MSLKQFIKENKEIIDGVIKAQVPDARINDNERKLWIQNDESLWRFARRKGVNV